MSNWAAMRLLVSIDHDRHTGVLNAAKDRGLITTVANELDALRDKVGFWIGDDLYRAVLGAAGDG